MWTEVSEAARRFVSSGEGLADIFVLRFIKPFDENYFKDLVSRYSDVLFVEDGVKTGGISEYLETVLLKNGFKNTKIKAFDEKFYSHGSRNQVLQEAGLDAESLFETLKS